MGKNEYLCPCLKITKKDIKEAIADGAEKSEKEDGSFPEMRPL